MIYTQELSGMTDDFTVCVFTSERVGGWGLNYQSRDKSGAEMIEKVNATVILSIWKL